MGSASKESLKEQIEKIGDEYFSIKYGTLNIVVQDGVIVQIEKNEKFRFK